MKPLSLTIDDERYSPVIAVLHMAVDRMTVGKGEQRHTPEGSNRSIEDQAICVTRREVGPGFTMGQVAKKAYEASRLDGEQRINECLDIINYAVVEVIVSMDE